MSQTLAVELGLDLHRMRNHPCKASLQRINTRTAMLEKMNALPDAEPRLGKLWHLTGGQLE